MIFVPPSPHWNVCFDIFVWGECLAEKSTIDHKTLEVCFNLRALAAYTTPFWTPNRLWVCALPAVTPNTFYSRSGPWMDHDGPRMCREQSRIIKATRVYKFLSPPVYQVCVFSLGCHWKVCPIKDTTRAGHSSRKTQQLSGIVPLACTEQIFSCHWGPTFFFLLNSGLVRRAHPRPLWRLASSPVQQPVQAAGI